MLVRTSPTMGEMNASDAKAGIFGKWLAQRKLPPTCFREARTAKTDVKSGRGWFRKVLPVTTITNLKFSQTSIHSYILFG